MKKVILISGAEGAEGECPFCGEILKTIDLETIEWGGMTSVIRDHERCEHVMYQNDDYALCVNPVSVPDEGIKVKFDQSGQLRCPFCNDIHLKSKLRYWGNFDPCEHVVGISESEDGIFFKENKEEIKLNEKIKKEAKTMDELVIRAARSFKEWMDYLKGKVSEKKRRQFKHIWKKSLEGGKGEEYAARAAIDILPKDVLKKPTPAHGKGKVQRPLAKPRD